jgi:hypothetical protein
MNRAFSKEEVQMTKKTHKEMLTIPDHKEMQVKTTLNSTTLLLE